ncbi:LysM peptidoglycan-binding domain-containing protein [Weissella muntiaci]|uniref:LysM peptidoglycan-binding domain-containing protein n=1 Tax=Weissella muntiaci TaxID=2508881 RepID=A0A6C2C7V4_9LACO|nr:LysM peptidoglycan-binding domain-containing protein [Weissella muntiaci]TYC50068.1 LysM peptidoglycan-binding domain-containing protein [Weissella muntiaci]
MGKVSKRTVFAGVAGTIGVVATTQIPGVQAAVEKLAEGQVSDPATEATSQTKNTFAKVSSADDKTNVRTATQVAQSQEKKATSKQNGMVVEKDQTDNAVVTVDKSASSQSTSSEAATATPSEAPVTPAESAAIASTTPQVKPANTVQVTIQDGDTLTAIATQFGVTVNDIVAANQTDLSLLQIGTVIYVPDANDSTNVATGESNSNNSLTDAEKSDVVSVAQTMANEQVTGISAATFVSQVFAQAGITLPASTIALEGSSTISTDTSSAQAGDLLFWGTQGASYNVAISLGGNLYIGVSLETGQVQFASFDATNGPSFIGSVN